MNPKFFDAHSHGKPSKSAAQTLTSYSFPEETPLKDSLYCYGSHPWSASSYNSDQFEAELKAQITEQNFVALGECGLDKASEIPWELQLTSFESQIELACKYQIQVVIIHCVKAYSEILAVAAAKNFKGILVFHDFNASFEVAKELIHKGHVMSLGKTLDRENSKVPSYLSQDMLESILLESDAEDLDIKSRYSQLAKLMGATEVQIAEILWKNAVRIFGLN